MSETEKLLQEPEYRKILKDIIREVIQEELNLEIKGRTVYLDGNYVLDNIYYTVTMNGEYVCGGDCF